MFNFLRTRRPISFDVVVQPFKEGEAQQTVKVLADNRRLDRFNNLSLYRRRRLVRQFNNTEWVQLRVNYV